MNLQQINFIVVIGLFIIFVISFIQQEWFISFIILTLYVIYAVWYNGEIK